MSLEEMDKLWEDVKKDGTKSLMNLVGRGNVFHFKQSN
jgi:hypothetical protein